MNHLIGNSSLAAAVVVAALTAFACLMAASLESRRFLVAAKVGLCVFALFFSAASTILLTALVDSDFSLRYVVHYTEVALPLGYKLAAFWAGQEGSLLLWGWMVALMSVVAAFTHRSVQIRSGAVFIGTLAALCGFFAALMLFAANPFAPAQSVVTDGQGLNPLLQNIGMIAHPPLLFMGYAGFSIPFALMIAALAGGRKPEMALGEVRNWTIFSWLFLSIGIVLGAQWAYVELGWGGYWGWDPVENASLLPWLTATALLHSLIIQQHRGMLKIWNVVLIASNFLLCIFGTYLTRSGIVQSVHGFGASLVGTFFLIFLLLVTLVSIVMIAMRLRGLRSENALDNIFGREGAFLIMNVLLGLMMLVTLVGTIFPVISALFVTEPVSVDQTFYNKTVVPLGLLLVALMACGPLLVYGLGAGRRLGRGMIVPGIFAGVTVVVMCVMRLANPWALACGAIIAAALAAMIIDLGTTVRDRSRNNGESLIRATLRVLDGNHRRYGGQLVHMGMLMMVAGIAGSSLFNINQDLHLVPGQTVQVGRYAIKFDSIEQIEGENYTAIQANLELTDPSGATGTLKPQRRFYPKAEQPNSEVALRSSLREDLYTTLAGWDDDGKQVAIQAIINPLVNWLWIGGIALGLGGIVCMLPRFGGAVAPAEVAVEGGQVAARAVSARVASGTAKTKN